MVAYRYIHVVIPLLAILFRNALFLYGSFSLVNVAFLEPLEVLRAEVLVRRDVRVYIWVFCHCMRRIKRRRREFLVRCFPNRDQLHP